MAATRRSFTVKAGRILRQLQTPCFVSVASKDWAAATAPPSTRYSSIWDTGATFSMVAPRVENELGLQPVGYANVHHAGGQTNRVPLFYVDMLLFNNVRIKDISVGVTSARDIDVIIGMDIINRGDFAISNRDGATTFSFRIPSIERFDFVGDDNRHASASDL